MGRYTEVFRQSLTDPDGFWAEAARAIDWYRAPTAVLDRSNPPFYRWFPDGVLNTCFNALDRHVRDGRGGQAALIYDSPVTGTVRTYTYAELLDEVARFAGVLRGLGVRGVGIVKQGRREEGTKLHGGKDGGQNQPRGEWRETLPGAGWDFQGLGHDRKNRTKVQDSSRLIVDPAESLRAGPACRARFLTR